MGRYKKFHCDKCEYTWVADETEYSTKREKIHFEYYPDVILTGLMKDYFKAPCPKCGAMITVAEYLMESDDC